MSQPVPLVLASNSPRRRQLLALSGWQFRIQSAPIDEMPYPGEAPRLYVLRMAEGKARTGANRAQPGELVIGADTIVVDFSGSEHDQGVILGKPADEWEATSMLCRLRSQIHQVITAVAVYQLAQERCVSELCSTSVKMRDYTDAEIAAYVSSGDPLDKAGAYAIQHVKFNPVESLQGCFANVVGLPLCLLNRCLTQFGFDAAMVMPHECHHEDCPFCQKIIREPL